MNVLKDLYNGAANAVDSALDSVAGIFNSDAENAALEKKRRQQQMMDELNKAGIETTTMSKPSVPKDIQQEVLKKIQNTSSIPDWVIPAVTSAANIGGGILANKMAQSDYDKAMNTLKQKADLAGSFTTLGPSQTSLIPDNPELVGMQLSALRKMQGLADTGTTPEDEAYRRQQQDAVNQQYQARAVQQQDDLHRRGIQAGSGLGLAQAMTNNQQALQQSSQAADADMIRKAEAKKAAIQSLANMAGSTQQGAFNRDVVRAGAVDQIAKFNAENQNAANINKANALTAISNAEAQQGARTSDLINQGAQVISGGLSAWDQAQQKNKKQ